MTKSLIISGSVVAVVGVTLVGALSFAQPINRLNKIPTYYRDVAQVLKANCVSCHTVGGIAPFSLEDPQSAVDWSARIVEVTRSGLMPPWPPAQGGEPLVGERRLSNDDKQLLADWVAAGSPLGESPKGGK